MEELDLLKKDWKRTEHAFSQVSEKDIYMMLHRKSSSLVKWILIISVLEVLLWTGIAMFFAFDEYLESVKHEALVVFSTVLNYLNYPVILIFIYLFYKNYRNISTTASTKDLMRDILRTRKTVRNYVWYNLAMMVLSFVIGILLAINYSPEVAGLREKMSADEKYMVLTLALLVLTIILAFVIFWLFYRLLYGRLLRKLLVNYKELQKIDF